LRLIENQNLLKQITSLYTAEMPFQVNADEYIYGSRRTDYNTYIGTKLFTMEIIYIECIRQKKDLAKDIRSVIAEIDKELNK